MDSSDAPESAGFWNKASGKKQRQKSEAAMWADPDEAGKLKRARSQKRRRYTLISLATIFTLLIVFAPTIAGAFLPGIIESTAKEAIKGSLKVQRVKLAWTGPQVIGPLKLTDSSGGAVANISIEAGASLFSLAAMNFDLGEIRIKGSATIERGTDGKLNIERAVEPVAPSRSTPRSAKPPSIPESFAARIIARGLDIAFIDRSSVPGTSASLKDLDIKGSIRPGKPIDLRIGASAAIDAKRSGGSPSSVSAPGSLSVNVSIENWCRPDGTLTPASTSGDVELIIKSVPCEFMDVLAAVLASGAIEPGAARGGLGERFNISLAAKGSKAGGSALLSFTSPGADAEAKAVFDGKQLVTDGPVRVRASGDAIRSFVPQIQRSLGAQDNVAVASFPGLMLVIDKVRLPLSTDGKPLDLRGAAADIDLSIEPVSGTVRLESGGEPKPFAISGVRTTIKTEDLVKGAFIKTDSSMTVDARPAGVIAVDMRASGLLDQRGAPARGLPALEGNASIKGIATAIAQPFVQELKIDLPADIGPMLDINLTSAPTGAAISSDGFPPTRLDLNIKSANITLAAALRIETNGMFGALRLDAPKGALLARRFLAPDSGFTLQPDLPGAFVFSMPDFSVPCTNGPGTAQLDNASARMEVVLGDWAIRSTDPSAAASGPLLIRELSLKPVIAPGQPPKISVTSSISHGARNFSISGGFDLHGLIEFAANGDSSKKLLFEPAKARPVGSLDIRAVPMSLLTLAAAKPQEQPAASRPLDPAKLITDAVGGTADIRITSIRGASTDAIGASIDLDMARLKAGLRASISRNKFTLDGIQTDATISPDAADTLVRQFAPNLAAASTNAASGPLRLVEPAKFSAKVNSLSIPLDASGKPDWARAGELTATIGIPGKAVIDGLALTNDDGSPRPLGPLGIEKLKIDLKAPLSGVMSDTASASEAVVSSSANVISRQQVLLALDSRLQTGLRGGKPANAFSANVSLARIDAKLLGDLVGQHDKLALGVGDSLSIDVSAAVQAPKEGANAPIDFAKSRIDSSIHINAPRLRSTTPIRVALLSDRISLDGASTLTLEATPDLVNPFLDPPAKPGQPASTDAKSTPTLSLSQPASIRIGLQRLVVYWPDAGVQAESRPGGGVGDAPPIGPMKPGIFDLALTIAMPELKMAMSDGVPVRIEGIEIKAESDPKAAQKDAPLSLNLKIAETVIGDKPPAKNMKLDVGITNLADENGMLTMQRAVLSASGDLPTLPVALIDSLANQNGTLLEALGPTAGIKIRADHLPLLPASNVTGVNILSNSSLDLSTTADRAGAKIKGTIRDGIFYNEEPIDIAVLEMTKSMAARLVRGLPMIGSLEKKRADAPAKVVGTAMTVPLFDDMSKLNGEVSIDPGEAHFGASTAFGNLLKAASAKDSGVGGKKLEPMLLHIKDGVATYERYKIPLGEFIVESGGTVDLVKKHIDVVTWIPIGALTDEAVGAFKTGALLGKSPALFEGARLLPFRTKGHLDRPDTSPDLDLFLKEIVSKIKPEKLIEQGLGDLLKSKPTPPKTPPPK